MNREDRKTPEKILIVDDLEVSVGILENIIRAEGYEPLCALNVQEALEIMNRTMPQLILSDHTMPGMSGVDFCRLLKKNPRTRDIPFILITVADSSEVKKIAFEAGVVDYIPKPFERLEVVMRVNNQMSSYRAKQEIEEHNRMMHRVIEEQKALVEKEQENLLLTLTKVVEKRNSQMGRHLERVGHNCRILAQSLQLTEQYEQEISDDFVEIIATASKLHDIGALVIPDETVKEVGANSATDDSACVRLHIQEGVSLLEEIAARSSMSRFLEMAISITKFHQACWDGQGYPEGIHGSGIPLAARIVSVIDDFDLEAESRGTDAGGREQAVEAITQGSGTKYDPGIVRVFAKIIKQLKLPG